VPGNTAIRFHLANLAYEVEETIDRLIRDLQTKRRNNAAKRQQEEEAKRKQQNEKEQGAKA
jgi:hypothetical protein